MQKPFDKTWISRVKISIMEIGKNHNESFLFIKKWTIEDKDPSTVRPNFGGRGPVRDFKNFPGCFLFYFFGPGLIWSKIFPSKSFPISLNFNPILP